MPTGYTSKLYDGKKQTFQEFAMECARAFGALVTLRDDSDAKIPDEFKPSEYAQESLKKAEKKLKEAIGWSDAAAAAKALVEYNNSVKEYEASKERSAGIVKRYREMLAEVKKWTPPTPDHENMKKFMVEQLESSIKFDNYTPDKPKMLTGPQYKKEIIEGCQKDIGYYTKSHLEEVQRCEGRTAWVKALRDSLLELA